MQISKKKKPFSISIGISKKKTMCEFARSTHIYTCEGHSSGR